MGGSVEIVEYFQEKMEISKSDKFGRSPLFYACSPSKINKEELVEFLIDQKITVETSTSVGSPFFQCSQNFEILKILIDRFENSNLEVSVKFFQVE
jgi:ankyrin repeat protein